MILKAERIATSAHPNCPAAPEPAYSSSSDKTCTPNSLTHFRPALPGDAPSSEQQQDASRGNVVVLSQSPEAVDLADSAEAIVEVTLLPLNVGVQQLPTLCLQDVQRRTTYDTMNLTIHVHQAA